MYKTLISKLHLPKSITLFVAMRGKRALIIRALYGDKSAGRDFCNNLRACMMHLHFKPCPTNPDAWMQSAKKSNGHKCYDYVLLYVDDALVISDNG